VRCSSEKLTQYKKHCCIKEPVTKMVDKRELKWFGLLITMGEA